MGRASPRKIHRLHSAIISLSTAILQLMGSAACWVLLGLVRAMADTFWLRLLSVLLFRIWCCDCSIPGQSRGKVLASRRGLL